MAFYFWAVCEIRLAPLGIPPLWVFPLYYLSMFSHFKNSTHSCCDVYTASGNFCYHVFLDNLFQTLSPTLQRICAILICYLAKYQIHFHLTGKWEKMGRRSDLWPNLFKRIWQHDKILNKTICHVHCEPFDFWLVYEKTNDLKAKLAHRPPSQSCFSYNLSKNYFLLPKLSKANAFSRLTG